MARKSTPKPDPFTPVEYPAIVAIDTREQLPFAFTDLRADADQDNRPLQIHTVRATLKQGDYSLVGHEHAIALERKSIDDLYGTIGGGDRRERFVRELERLAGYLVAGVIVEASWHEILTEPPPHTQVKPKTIYRSILAWSQRYPRIHWWMMGTRRLAEVTTFRILDRYYREFIRERSK